MTRKTDAEVLDEMNEIKKKLKEDKIKIKELGGEVEDNEEDEEDEKDLLNLPEIELKNQSQVVEREINLSLINDKLNFIMSLLQGKEEGVK